MRYLRLPLFFQFLYCLALFSLPFPILFFPELLRLLLLLPLMLRLLFLLLRILLLRLACHAFAASFKRVSQCRLTPGRAGTLLRRL